jgi:hypothetical protein
LNGLHFHLEEIESDRLSKDILSNLWDINYSALSLDLQSFLSTATSKIQEDIDRLIVSRLRETPTKLADVAGSSISDIIKQTGGRNVTEVKVVAALLRNSGMRVAVPVMWANCVGVSLLRCDLTVVDAFKRICSNYGCAQVVVNGMDKTVDFNKILAGAVLEEIQETYVTLFESKIPRFINEFFDDMATSLKHFIDIILGNSFL